MLFFNDLQLALAVGRQQQRIDGEPGRSRRPDAGRRAEPLDAAAAAGEAEAGQRSGERLALLGDQRRREAGGEGRGDGAAAAAEAEGAAACRARRDAATHAAQEALLQNFPRLGQELSAIDRFVPRTTMPRPWFMPIAKDYLNYAICHALTAIPTFKTITCIHNQ